MFNKNNTALSRKELLKKNPLGWMVAFILMIYIFGVLLFPKLVDWKKMFTTVRKNGPLIQKLTTENAELTVAREAKRTEFDELSNKILIIEKQIFPEKLDLVKVVRILEIYAIELNSLSTSTYSPYLDLKSVSFGQTSKPAGSKYSKTDATMKFSADDLNIKEFVSFLQTSNLSQRLETEMEKRKSLPNNPYYNNDRFLQDNLLPIVHIESINITPLTEPNRFNADLRLTIFSQ